MIAALAVLAAAVPPARPAILYNRWQEDWSVLADTALRTGRRDALKYVPLGPPEARAWLTLGAGLRNRFETNEAPLFGVVPGRGDSYVITRAEVFADVHAGPVQVFAQLISAFAPGKAVKGPVDSNRLDIEQAFVAFVHPMGGGTIKLRAGRQQFAFDLQRFVSARDGPNVRQSFDALWGDYEIGAWRFIGYWSQPVVTRDRRPFDDVSNSRNRFSGVRIERHVLGDNELSAYWSRFRDDDADFIDAGGRERRDVWDVRFAGKRGAIDWDAEAMLQSGYVGTSRIRAWAMGSRIGYTMAQPWTPRWGLQLDAASGDEHPGDGVVGTFNPLFPNGNYVTLAGYTGYVNYLHVKPSLTVHPSARVTIMAAGAAQWRMTTADAVYTQPPQPVPGTAGEGTRWTGAYGQLRADWQANANFSMALEAVHFGVGQTLRDAGGSDGNYLGIEAKYGW
ncbi:alginate export family protein [Polymorphobacter fuscus]|uniref:Alginate export family protein n=1 Tax=Sandarakinorhabdus fusca TaxID=1439888 RepID=A0A7C9KVQ4_9SPHN|nr:alginate export family protein [Polymorphobacter fuscus]KAB7648556.1 alginate export family protein [Polymorphobacter fuscus]MQT16102.1 alginate export family protein [Polymorphobacter fuscus]NJC07619.1 hypothetical protein [Polymorphobacter fuscus]